jgi:hypothetical protein
MCRKGEADQLVDVESGTRRTQQAHEVGHTRQNDQNHENLDKARQKLVKFHEIL